MVSPVSGRGPQSAGPVRALVSCSTAPGVSLDQGLNPNPLPWQEESCPLCPQGSPLWRSCYVHAHCIGGSRLSFPSYRRGLTGTVLPAGRFGRADLCLQSACVHLKTLLSGTRCSRKAVQLQTAGPAQLPVGPLSTLREGPHPDPCPPPGLIPTCLTRPPGTQGCCRLSEAPLMPALCPLLPDVGEGLLACGLCPGGRKDPAECVL